MDTPLDPDSTSPFLPATAAEVRHRGWDSLDIILVTGDSYLDSPFVGIAVIGRVLATAGYRVGIIAQPAIDSSADITRLGEPTLFWGVSGGCIDSLVANRTASGKRRRKDDYTAGGQNHRRPDRAVIVYSNLIRRYFKKTVPIVLGGIEASLRRIAHYDFWSNRIRRSILTDAKADWLVYGMGEKTVLALAARLKAGQDSRDLRGLCWLSTERPSGYLELPGYGEAATDRTAFTRMFLLFYENQDALTAQGLCQKQDSRWLVHNPPMLPLTEAEMDQVYDLPFTRDCHPLDRRAGRVKALETIRFSITTHRGCYGECHFCAIAIHEGRTVSSRTETSILREANQIAALPDFRGHILNCGGPTANMYGFECSKKLSHGACRHRRCLIPGVCPSLGVNHSRQRSLLADLRHVPGVKQVTVASGIRPDLVLADRRHGMVYLDDIVRHHCSGQLKLAPEHSEEPILRLMGKPNTESLLTLRHHFRRLTAKSGKRQFLTYYLIAAHPGCTDQDMEALRRFATGELGIHPEQVQIFTPTPSTLSTLMYWTEHDPFTHRTLFVEKTQAGRERQKHILVAKIDQLSYGISEQKTTQQEGQSWARTKMLRKKPKRSHPKR